MNLYKFTEQDGTTYNKSMSWEIGKTNSIEPCDNPELCTNKVIHAYKNLNLGLLMNPIHADIQNPKIFICEGDIVIEDYSKCGVFELTLMKEIKIPEWYLKDEIKNKVLVYFSILCAESVLHLYEKKYNDDKPRNAIKAAREYLNNGHATARAARAAYAAANAAARAAYAAANAAASAAYAAANAAASAAANAYAYAAANAAANAARAANAADYSDNKKIDFCKLADEAVFKYGIKNKINKIKGR